MTSGFLGENLNVFGVFSRESFLWLRCLSLHGQVGRHSQFIEGGSCKRSDEMRDTLLDVVDDERIDCLFREVFWGFGGEVSA